MIGRSFPLLIEGVFAAGQIGHKWLVLSCLFVMVNR